MLEYGDFEAWLECDGEEMPVYDVKAESGSREISCFLLAEEGKVSPVIPILSSPTEPLLMDYRPNQTFTIHWKDRGSGVSTAAYIELDGVTVPGKFLHGNGATFRSGIRTGPESERPFAFAKVPDESACPADYPVMHGH